MNVQNQQSQRQAARGDGDGTTGEGEPIAAQAWNVVPESSIHFYQKASGSAFYLPIKPSSTASSLYEVLISMRYISCSDIYWPPYPTSLFTRSNGFRRFEQEVVDLLALLAYPKVGSNLDPS
jgi:hypothetical protein